MPKGLILPDQIERNYSVNPTSIKFAPVELIEALDTNTSMKEWDKAWALYPMYHLLGKNMFGLHTLIPMLYDILDLVLVQKGRVFWEVSNREMVH